MSRVKVWGVNRSASGYNAVGEPITIRPGTFGWMDAVQANEAVRLGIVELAAGHSTRSLPTATYETREEEPETLSTGSAEDEPDWLTPAASAKKVPVKKPPVKKAPVKRYRRRDYNPEDA